MNTVTDSHVLLHDDDGFDFVGDMSAGVANKRTAVRYLRSDIVVTLSFRNMLGLGKISAVILRDISSKGIAIISPKRLPLHGKVALALAFNDGAKFKINATVVYAIAVENRYGLKFDRFDHQLGDHLLASQTDLVFSR